MSDQSQKATQTIVALTRRCQLAIGQIAQAFDANQANVNLVATLTAENNNQVAQAATYLSQIDALQLQVVSALAAPAAIQNELDQVQIAFAADREQLISAQDVARLAALDSTAAREAAAAAEVRLAELQAADEAEDAELAAAIAEAQALLNPSVEVVVEPIPEVAPEVIAEEVAPQPVYESGAGA
jgi:hypothetical protein